MAGLAASGGLVVLPIAPSAALPVAIVVIVALVVALVRNSPTVEVAAAGVRAGRAVLPWTAVGEVSGLDPAAMRQELGVRLHGRAYLCQRGWIATGVKIVVDDAADPTPYWLISSRHPSSMLAAIDRGRPPHGCETD
jgi:Protein of unknown function (DUF3093)